MPSPVSKHRILSPASIWDRDVLLSAMQERGILPMHAHTLWRHIVQKNVLDPADIPHLPVKLVRLIKEDFAITTSEVVKRTDARDGSTTKLLIRLQGGKMVETVIMRYVTVQQTLTGP